MALFKFTFLRNFIRRHSRPIPENSAFIWRRRLAVAYMLVAWNALGYVGYQYYQGKGDWAKYYGLKTEQDLKMRPSEGFAQVLGVKKAEVYRISGLNVSHYKIGDENEEVEAKTETV